MSVKDHTILTLMASLELCIDRMSGLMGPDKLSSFCNYYVELHLPTSCGAFTFGGRMRPRAKTSSQEQGARFRPSRDLWMVVMCESLQESNVWRVGQVLPLQGVYQFESPQHSRLWVVACRCSHVIVCLVYHWWIWGVGYGYVHGYSIIMFIVFAYLDVDMGQRSACLRLF
jgi:hypothetical protein